MGYCRGSGSCSKATQLSLSWILPMPQQGEATRNPEGGAAWRPESVSSRSPIRGRWQSAHWKVGEMGPTPKPYNAVTDTPKPAQTSGWCFVSSYWFFPIRINTFTFLTHTFKSTLVFTKDTAIPLVPQAHVNGITVQAYLPRDLRSNSSPSISKCLTLFEAPIYLISVLLR